VNKKTLRLGGGVAVVVAALLAATTTLPASADPTTLAMTGPRVTAPPADTGGTDDHENEDIHADPAMLAASTALVGAEKDLSAARLALAAVRKELVTARELDEQARVDLLAAEMAEDRAARAVATVRQRIIDNHTSLGRLASAAYRANGPLNGWSLVLASQTPEQLVDRLAFVQSVSNAGNSMISDLREDRANLMTLQARLAAARMLQQRKREDAAAAVRSLVAKETEAARTERQLNAVVLLYQAALDAALDAKADDQARYQLLTAQSGRLGERIRSMAAQLAKLPHQPKGTGTFVRPGTGELTSPFGPRLHPILRYVKVHTGVDFGRGDGIVYAADRGVVLFTEFNTAYGNMTVIDHGTVGGLRMATLYAHQAAFGVHPGDRVRKGQPIGVIGSTGYATGPHLHFEVRINGAPVNPAPFLERAPLPVTAAHRSS
jgi:murein DD-endopeptidase MepM/ murein hydrolase activator NlpD